MKKLFAIILAVSVISFTHSARGQSTANPTFKVFDVGTTHDTAHGNATFHQISSVSPGSGLTVQYRLDQINDSCAGAVSIWGSIDNIDYFPYPGADSVAITAGVDIWKGWLLVAPPAKVGIKFLDVRTRLTSTYTVCKGKVKTKVLPY